MSRVGRLACAAVALLSFAASTALADDGLRCGVRLVTVGEFEAAVAAKCGPPGQASRHVESWCDDGYASCTHIVVDLWTYDRGPSEFVRTLRFENMVLRHVFVGDYGVTQLRR